MLFRYKLGYDLRQNAKVSANDKPNIDKDKVNVKDYLDSLKKIIDNSDVIKDKNLSVELLKSLDGINIDPKKIEPVVKKCMHAMDLINKLKPPNPDTVYVQNLALDIFKNIKKVIELSSKIVKADHTIDMNAVSEMYSTYQDSAVKAKAFNDKVKEIRKKYNIGTP